MRPFNRSIFVLLRLIVCAFLLTLWFHFSAGCSTIYDGRRADSSRSSPAEPKNNLQGSLTISPDSDELAENPKLLQRVLEGPHGYFRYINIQFAQAVCVRFQEYLNKIPNVNLQGDPHLENYAITERGRGLTDFDDATIGPMVLDLVRFGVSIRLACRANGWDDKAEEIVDSFLSSYRAALENPELTIPPPELVTRIRSRFTTDTARALKTYEGLMKPLEGTLEDYKKPFNQFLEQMARRYPDLPPHFFKVKKAGRLQVGIGSALDEKYLLFVEGPTTANKDDVVLEIKEVKDLSGISCILLSEATPMRPILMQTRLAYKPYRYMGSIVISRRKGYKRDKTFWVHEWYDNYQELSIRTSFKTPTDLQEIAADAGFQLGLGHPKSISDSYSRDLRKRLVSTLAELQEMIELAIFDLTQQTVAAWEQFRREATSGKTEKNY